MHALLFEGREALSDDTGSTAQALAEANLVTEDPRRGKRATPALSTVLSGDLMGYPVGQEPEVRMSHVLRLFKAASMTALRLRSMSLDAIANRVRDRKKRRAPRPAVATPTALVEIFKRLRPLLFTAKNRCLYDSLVLLEFLASYDVFPTWVIAVRMGPFSAHSWVQDETIVYNDEVANVSRFTPILTI